METEKSSKQSNNDKIRIAIRLIAVVVLVAVAIFMGVRFSVSSASQEADDGMPGEMGDSEGRVLIVGIFDIDLPPLFYGDADGNLVGFEIDLLEEVAGRVGWEVEVVRVGDGYEDALNAGDVGVVWGNIADTPETRKRLLLTKPYLRTAQVAVVSEDSDVENLGDLDGKDFAALMWTPADQFMKDHTFGIAFRQLGAYSPYPTAFDALRAGSVAAVLCDETLADYVIEGLDGAYVVLPEPLGEANYAAAFKQGDSTVPDAVQKALDEIAADGAGERISQKWFHKDLYVK